MNFHARINLAFLGMGFFSALMTQYNVRYEALHETQAYLFAPVEKQHFNDPKEDGHPDGEQHDDHQGREQDAEIAQWVEPADEVVVVAHVVLQACIVPAALAAVEFFAGGGLHEGDVGTQQHEEGESGLAACHILYIIYI